MFVAPQLQTSLDMQLYSTPVSTGAWAGYQYSPKTHEALLLRSLDVTAADSWCGWQSCVSLRTSQHDPHT